MVRTKRVYESSGSEAGAGFLVERLWPRGMKKESLRMDDWLTEVAHSDGLRRWFGHDPAKWYEFGERYFKELESKPEAIWPILETARAGRVTLLYNARDTEHNMQWPHRSI